MTDEQKTAIINAYASLMDIEKRSALHSISAVNHHEMLMASESSVRELETVFPELLDELIPYRGEKDE